MININIYFVIFFFFCFWKFVFVGFLISEFHLFLLPMLCDATDRHKRTRTTSLHLFNNFFFFWQMTQIYIWVFFSLLRKHNYIRNFFIVILLLFILFSDSIVLKAFYDSLNNFFLLSTPNFPTVFYLYILDVKKIFFSNI